MCIVAFALGAGVFFSEPVWGPWHWMFTFTEVAGAIAVAFGALNWTYQVGSRRLGIVDMFSAEISVICRVCVVMNFARGSVEQAKKRILAARAADPGLHLPAESGGVHGSASALRPLGKFTSQEDYTPCGIPKEPAWRAAVCALEHLKGYPYLRDPYAWAGLSEDSVRSLTERLGPAKM